MGGADVLSDIVENARGVFVRRPQFTRRVKRGERRLRLDRELVERNMLASFRQCRAQLARPLFRCLTGTCIDEVERITTENRARHAKRIKRFARRMGAAKRGEVAILERLDAE